MPEEQRPKDPPQRDHSATHRSGPTTLASIVRSLDRSVLSAASVWREQLLATTEVLQNATAVSRLVAETMAARQTYLIDQFAPIRAAADNAVAIAIGQMDLTAFTREVAAGPLRDLNAALAEALRPIAHIAAVNWSEQFRGWADEGGQLDAELRRYGWWMHPGWTPRQGRSAVEIARERGKRALDRELCRHYRVQRHRRLREMVDGWTDDAYVPRRAIVRQALQAHRRGAYLVAIPALLPLIEGIAVEVFKPPDSLRHPVTLIRTGMPPRGLFGQVVTDAMLETLTVLWRSSSFATLNPLSRGLNRHHILHGVTVRYGTEANSLKVFLTLDHLASQVGTKRTSDARAA